MSILMLDEYQKLAARTINTAKTKEELIQHAKDGMISELGELFGLHQKVIQGHKFDEEHAMKELGDAFWFIAEYCTMMGWSMGDVAQMNVDKLRARYPEGFETERSLYRAEGDI